jgi:hypothetical protein
MPKLDLAIRVELGGCSGLPQVMGPETGEEKNGIVSFCHNFSLNFKLSDLTVSLKTSHWPSVRFLFLKEFANVFHICSIIVP